MERKVYYFNKSQHYAGDNPELTEIPRGWIDKKIAGVGLTTLAIEQHTNTIIFVPTKTLIWNKVQQYPNDRCSFTVLGVDGDTNDSFMDVDSVLHEQLINQGYYKVICTIDSYTKVKKYLGECKIIVDESQLILQYMHMKANNSSSGEADVYTRFLNDISNFRDSVSFISATPPDRKYFHKQHGWIEELPFIEFQFEDVAKVKPFLFQRNNPTLSVYNEIILPLLENGSVDVYEKPDTNSGTVISVEGAVIFLNSIKEIKKMIDKIDSKYKDKIGYIVGDSLKNSVSLANYQKITDVNNLPKIVFITSTGFQGIDLYSKTHIQIIVGSAESSYCKYNLDTVKQMISRVRDFDNIHYGTYMYYYSQNQMQQEEEQIDAEYKKLNGIATAACKNINNATDAEEREYQEQATKEDVFTYIYKEDDTYVVNTTLLEYEAESRKELSKIFTDGFDFRYACFYNETPIDFQKPKNYDYSRKGSKNKLGYPAMLDAFNGYVSTGTEPETTFTANTTYQEIKFVYEKTGKIYQRQDLFIKAVNKLKEEEMLLTLKHQIQAAFNMYWLYDSDEIKEKLQEVYDNNQLNRKAKTGDLIEFFEADKVRKDTKVYYRISGRK